MPVCSAHCPGLITPGGVLLHDYSDLLCGVSCCRSQMLSFSTAPSTSTTPPANLYASLHAAPVSSIPPGTDTRHATFALCLDCLVIFSDASMVFSSPRAPIPPIPQYFRPLQGVRMCAWPKMLGLSTFSHGMYTIRCAPHADRHAVHPRTWPAHSGPTREGVCVNSGVATHRRTPARERVDIIDRRRRARERGQRQSAGTSFCALGLGMH